MALGGRPALRRRDRRLRRAARVTVRGLRSRSSRRPRASSSRSSPARGSARAVVREDGRPPATDRPTSRNSRPAALRRGRGHMIEQEARTVFADVYGPPPRLFVYGAVDTAEALCRVGGAARLDDDRRRRAPALRDPRADPERRRAARALARRGARQVRPDTSTAIVVLTHDDKFDLPLLQAPSRPTRSTSASSARGATRSAAAACCSRRASRRTTLERIPGPGGLDVGADSPPETALSMLAEILAVRPGRAGGRLKDSRAPDPRRADSGRIGQKIKCGLQIRSARA